MDPLKKLIVNSCKSVHDRMWFYDRKFIKTIVENIMEHKTVVLTKLWDTKVKSADQWNRYYTRHLKDKKWSNLKEKIERAVLKLVWTIDSKIDFISMDTVDINKNSSKKMEWLKKVRDWSTWKIWNWFVFHSASVKWIPLFMDREKDPENKEEWIKLEIFKKQILKLLSYFWQWFWILADRWYDDLKKFLLLTENWFNFAIRLKLNRNIEILDFKINEKNNNRINKDGKKITIEKWKIFKSWDLPIWEYKVKLNWSDQEFYIFIDKLKWQDSPIKIISNKNDKTVILKYLERWEIERIFKSEKQEFNLEKVWTKDLQSTENLVYFVQLCMWISSRFYDNITDIAYNQWIDLKKTSPKKIENKTKNLKKKLQK